VSADDDRAAFVAWANGPDGIRGPRGADKGLRRVTAHLASPIHEVEEWARLAWSAAIAAEREACARACDDLATDVAFRDSSRSNEATCALSECAAAIRARGAS
jgi:hypothetical protein